MRICATFAKEASHAAATLLRGSIEECIKRTADFGFDCVEPQLNLDRDTLPDWNQVKAQCDSRGIQVAAYATGSLYVKNGLSFIDPDNAKARLLLDCLQLYIDAASITGGKVIIGCVRGNIKGANAAACQDKLAHGLAELLRRARDAGVTVLLEAINRYENDYLATAAQTVEFIKQ